MRSIPFWIQRADFSATEHDGVDLARALEIVTSHDWPGEWRLLAELDAAGQETYPPGIGFTAAPGHILHICPSAEGRALVHYQYSEPRRRLGFMPGTAAVVRSNSQVASSNVAEFVRKFFEGNHEWLVENTAV